MPSCTTSDEAAGDEAGGDSAERSLPHVNGALTIGENIGDLGGLGDRARRRTRLALADAGIDSVDEAPVIDELTGLQRFFFSWARDLALPRTARTSPS